MEQLQHGIVRIVNQQREPIGTGFLVTSEGHIVTCSHVLVPSSIQAKKEYSIPDKLLCQFYSNLSEEFEARVLRHLWYSVDDGDVAVLQLEHEIPDFCIPVKLISCNTLFNQEFRSIGFPLDKREGRPGYGKVKDEVQNRDFSEIMASSDTVTAGFSGGPAALALDANNSDNLVFGMLRAIGLPDPYNRGGKITYVIKAEFIAEKLGSLVNIHSYTPIKKRDVFDPFKDEDHLVTYLINRSEQDRAIQNKFRNKATSSYKSSHGIGILHGLREQCHLEYLHRLKYFTLEDIFNDQNQFAKPKLIGFEWPKTNDFSEISDQILMSIRRDYGDRGLGLQVEEIANNIYEKYNGPLVFHTKISSSKWNKVLEYNFIRFWDLWPTRPKNKLLITILQLEYNQTLGENEHVEDQLTNLDFGLLNNCCGFVFPKLESIDLDQFDSWLQNERVKRAIERKVPISVIESKVEKAFEDYQEKYHVNEIPMKKLIRIINGTINL